MNPSSSSGQYEPYNNNVESDRSCCFATRETNWSKMPDRRIYPLIQDDSLPDNSIQTSKYTWLTFLPINLWEQFSQLANVYFLFIAYVQTIPGVSITRQLPVMLIPLTIIMTTSALKSLFEDNKRHKSDNEENNRSTLVYRTNNFVEESWKNLLVGDIIKVVKNQPLPADIVLLRSSDPKGRCFVETKSLDGETNLKVKYSNKEISRYYGDVFDRNSSITVDYDRPNPYLYHFKGTVTINNEKISIDYSNFLLRGSSLKNTDFVYGLVVYTGHETKIMLNSTNAKPKQSKVDKKISTMVFITFMILVSFCTFTAFYSRIGLQMNRNASYYLHLRNYTAPFVRDILLRLGNWILIFNNFVPISMFLTLELVRFIQASVMASDKKMLTGDIEPSVQSSNLNEEIGQVEYMFSDKTGTLTSNQMVFKKISVNGVIYGGLRDYLSLRDSSEIERYDLNNGSGVTNVDFKDPNFLNILNSPRHQEYENIYEMLLAQAICHTVIIEQEKGSTGYSASSPDELALVNFAKYCQFEYQGTDENNIMRVQVAGVHQKIFQVLNVFEFSSDRKRMSVIVRDENNQIRLYTKGADSIIYERLAQSTSLRLKESTSFSLKCFGDEGLRTLVYSSRVLSEDEYAAWARQYHEASTSMVDREEKMEALQAEIEKDLRLLGATGIEDKLQDQVPETIQFIFDAEIKLWVLTGDKVETARSIGKSCGLIRQSMREILVATENVEELERVFHEALHENGEDYFIMVTGEALLFLSKPQNKELHDEFAKIAIKARTVLACRVSPKQKQEVVELVRKLKPAAITLAIGDGANDVNMITAAHVGVGIKGKEGLQAARASDFCFGEFKHLKRLVFLYGREYYRKNTSVVFYNFYKNMILVLPQFWYGFTNIFSGQTLYETFLNQFFHTLFAFLPIILYAIHDQQHSDKIFEKIPKLYDLGRKDQIFTYNGFLKWLANGAWQAFFILTLSFILVQNISLSSSTGYLADFWLSGSLVFSIAVLNVNIKILLMSYTHNMLIHLSLFGTIALYYISLVGLSYFRQSSEYFGVWQVCLGSPLYWAACFIIVFLTNGADMMVGRSFYLTSENYNSKKKPLGSTSLSKQPLLSGEEKSFVIDDSQNTIIDNDIL